MLFAKSTPYLRRSLLLSVVFDCRLGGGGQESLSFDSSFVVGKNSAVARPWRKLRVLLPPRIKNDDERSDPYHPSLPVHSILPHPPA